MNLLALLIQDRGAVCNVRVILGTVAEGSFRCTSRFMLLLVLLQHLCFFHLLEEYCSDTLLIRPDRGVPQEDFVAHEREVFLLLGHMLARNALLLLAGLGVVGLGGKMDASSAKLTLIGSYRSSRLLMECESFLILVAKLL